MLQLYFSHIFPPYNKKDASALALTVLSILAIAILVIVSSKEQTYQGRAQENQQAQFVKDQVLVKFHDDAPKSQRNEALLGVQGHIDKTLEQIKVHVVKVPEGMVEKVVESLSHNPNVEFAEPDYIAAIDEIPNDPSYASQKFLQIIREDLALDITHGNADVVIADLDTGVDLQHPDLGPKVILSKVFTGEASDGDDNNGHGTKTTGIAAAISGNSVGVASVSYNAKILNGKMCDSSGSCTYSAMSSALIWAADNNADAINLSVMGLSSSTTLQNAVDYAWNKGSIIAVAAGNCGDGTPSYCYGQVNPLTYPAYYSHAIAVGATTATDTKAWYSEYGTWVDVAAPVDGGLIYTTTNGGGYGGGNGTSFSAPQVAGLAGLLAGQHPEWTNTQIRSAIESTADKIAGTGTYWQYGRINAAAAVGAAVTNPTASPTTVPTNTPQPTPTLALLVPSSTPTPTLIPDSIPPTISIASPVNGSIVNRRGTLTITANASDNIGVDHVVLTVGGNVSTDYIAPYAYLWSVPGKPNASYTITATAYDISGNSASTSITVKSSN